MDEHDVIAKDMTLRGSKKAAKTASSSNPKSQTLHLGTKEDAEMQQMRRLGMAMQWAFNMMHSENPDATGSAPGFRSMGTAKRQKALTMGEGAGAPNAPSSKCSSC